MNEYTVEVNMNTRFIVTVNADSKDEAEDLACDESWMLARRVINPYGQSIRKDIIVEVNYDHQEIGWTMVDGNIIEDEDETNYEATQPNQEGK